MNKKLLNKLQILMTTDCAFPCKNDGVVLSIALDVFMEKWNELRKEKSPVKITHFYNDFMERISKLQKDEMLNLEVRNIRTMEEIKNAI